MKQKGTSLVRKLEHDVAKRYRFNRMWAIIWFVFLVVTPFLPILYGHSTNALFVQEISFCVNFVTHFASMRKALAHINKGKKINNSHNTVSGIRQVFDLSGNIE